MNWLRIWRRRLVSLKELWILLRSVHALSFEARSEAGTGWNGIGGGLVSVSEPSLGVLIFDESGYWQPQGRRDIRFTNVYRWTLLSTSLKLEHLRFGVDNPVYLFDLVPTSDGEWRDVSPHICAEDCYSACLRIEGQQLIVTWSINGPRKRETIRYVYQ